MPVNPTPSRPVVERLRARLGTADSRPGAGGAASDSATSAASSLAGAAQRVVRPVLDRIGMRAVAAVQPDLDDLRAQLDGVRAELDAVRAELAATRERLGADVELARAELANATAPHPDAPAGP